jgi:hypothetical protein
VQTRDAYGRFPPRRHWHSASASSGFRSSTLRRGAVARAAELWPRAARRARSYAVALTHDVDDPIASLGRHAGAARATTRRGCARPAGPRADGSQSPLVARTRARATIATTHTTRSTSSWTSASAMGSAARSTSSPPRAPRTRRPPTRSTTLDRLAVAEDPQSRARDRLSRRLPQYRDPELTRKEFDRLRAAAARNGILQSAGAGASTTCAGRTRRPGRTGRRRAGLRHDALLRRPDRLPHRYVPRIHRRSIPAAATLR